jgi:hypothetical protein
VRNHLTTEYEDKIMESINASAASSVTVSFVSHHDTFLIKQRGACEYGWKRRHGRGSQSVVLW